MAWRKTPSTTCPWGEAGARWENQHRLQLAVFEVDADQLVAQEDVENLQYC